MVKCKGLTKILLVLIFTCFVCGVMIGGFLVSADWSPHRRRHGDEVMRGEQKSINGVTVVFGGNKKQSDLPEKQKVEPQKADEPRPVLCFEVPVRDLPPPNSRVHAFYYPWYGAPGTDGRWLHWNHRYLSHWDKRQANRWQAGNRHVPPDDIGASFYPYLGAYSSRDVHVIQSHMRQLRCAAIGVAVVSWYPEGQADDEGRSWDSLLPLLLDVAHNYSIKISVHVEPFKNRSAETMLTAVKHLIDEHGSHPAFYRFSLKDQAQPRLPVFYVYDSYLLPAAEWARLLSSEGDLSVRGTRYDAVFLGLIVQADHRTALPASHFDGFYTYFASEGFTYGSSTRNWRSLQALARDKHMIFSPSVGPGYDDTRVRPWNAANTRERRDGSYYSKSWRAALALGPPFISLTSFNEWGEGTQIEAAVPRAIPGYTYRRYSPGPPDSYLTMTRQFVQRFESSGG